MQLLRGFYSSWLSTQPTVVAVGNFDGCHRGHHALLLQLLDLARSHKLPAWVILFEPQPQQYFSANDFVRIMSLREKCYFLRDLGIDGVLCLKFNQPMAQCTHANFARQILAEKLQARQVVVGCDFRYGYQREGNIVTLQQEGLALGFSVMSMPAVNYQGQRVSSTAIRNNLQQGQLGRAHELLGRSYSITGKVMHGARRGRQLGWPTANISLAKRRIPLHGVYAVTLQGPGGYWPGVANVGRRPTVDNGAMCLEVHLFGFDASLYGERVSVYFHKKVRDEKAFDSMDDLKEQIALDAEFAQDFLFNNQQHLKIVMG